MSAEPVHPAAAEPPSDPTVDDAIRAAQGAVARRTGREEEEPEVGGYAGFVTRLVAFAIDVLVIDVVAVATGGIVALAASFFELSSEVKTVMVALGGAAFVVWTIAYFVTFWTTTGQTIGSRVMSVKVMDPDVGDHLRPVRALWRLGWMVVAALPFFLGYALILIDPKRRALQDRLGGTVVVYAERKAPIT